MASAVSPQELRALLQNVTLIDVRRRAVYEAAQDMAAGAVWRDPEAVEGWAGTLPVGVPVVVYCVHGHAVSQGAADALQERGLDVRFLEGGLEGWRESGGPLQSAPR